MIKLLARDDETGRIGTYQAPFTVPNLNREEQRVPISSVVLSSQRVPLSDALYSVKQKTAAEAVNPLVLRRAEADAERHARVQQERATCTCSCRPTSAARRRRSRWSRSSRFYRGDVKAFETAPLAVTDGLDAKSKAVPLRFSVPLDELRHRPLRLPGHRARSDRPEGRLLARADRHRAMTRSRVKIIDGLHKFHEFESGRLHLTRCPAHALASRRPAAQRRTSACSIR